MTPPLRWLLSTAASSALLFASAAVHAEGYSGQPILAHPAGLDDPSKILVQASGETDVPVDVEPFGGISWSDSPATIIAKLNKLGKLETAVVDLQYAQADVKGLTTEAAVNKALEAALRKTFDFPGNKIKTDGALRAHFRTFLDDKSVEWHFYNTFIKLKARSLDIAGVQYDVLLEFLQDPGVVQLFPGSVAYYKGTPKIAVPSFLHAMHLKPIAGTDEQKHAVFAAIQKKYPMLDAGMYREARLKGPEGNLRFIGGEITYERNLDAEKKIQKAGKAATNAKDAAGKSDQTNQL